jgi:hypothetical protein
MVTLQISWFTLHKRNELPVTRNDVKWEPFIEYWMRKSMLELKVKRMIWQNQGQLKLMVLSKKLNVHLLVYITE